MNATGQLYFKTAIVLLVVGMAAGIIMAASGDHTIAAAHAHLNLLGFVVLAAYGTYFSLNSEKATGTLPKVIWGIHTLGVVVMFPFLALVLSGSMEYEPVVAIASIAVLIAAVLFGYVVWKPATAAGSVKIARA